MICTCPYISGFIQMTNPHHIPCYATRIRLIMFIYGKLIAIVFIQTVIRSKPHVPILVLCDINHCTLRQAFTQTDMRKPESFICLRIGRTHKSQSQEKKKYKIFCHKPFLSKVANKGIKKSLLSTFLRR